MEQSAAPDITINSSDPIYRYLAYKRILTPANSQFNMVGKSPLADITVAPGNKPKVKRPQREISRREPLAAADRETSSSPTTDEHGVVVISASHGDLILDIYTEEGNGSQFRVNTAALKSASRYFRRLLDPVMYQEGTLVSKQQEELRNQYSNITDAPSTDLPRVKIEDIGQTSSIKSIRPLMTDFLRILHDSVGTTTSHKILLKNIANLAIVADRFDAIEVVSRWAHDQGIFRRAFATASRVTEEHLRQALLVGLLLGHSPWVCYYSAQLMVNGSVKWKGSDSEVGTEALWCDLPHGIEGVFSDSYLQTTLISYRRATQSADVGFEDH